MFLHIWRMHIYFTEKNGKFKIHPLSKLMGEFFILFPRYRINSD